MQCINLFRTVFEKHCFTIGSKPMGSAVVSNEFDFFTTALLKVILIRPSVTSPNFASPKGEGLQPSPIGTLTSKATSTTMRKETMIRIRIGVKESVIAC
jgi:hypothetical protein